MMRDMQPSLEDFTFAMQVHHTVRAASGPRPGPFSVLLERLHQVAWQWISAAVFVDHHQVPCDILHCPIQELRERLCRAWQSKVLAECAPRKTMGSLQLMSPFLTTEALRQWPDEDQALLRNCLNGTFFTNDRRKHQKQAQSTDCKFCQQPDSQMHRQWHCTHFRECRHIPPEHVPDLESLPQAITCHGFVPEPPAYVPFKQACAQLYNDPVEFLWPPQVPEHLHLFTDGTCQAPACSFTRLAAWGFVIAMPDLHTFWPVANGILPGWSHTVLRAEIWGVIQACLFALACQRPCTLWIDNDLVFRRARQFMSRTCWFKPNQKDADLWTFMYRCIRSLGSCLVDVVKVCSHQNTVGARDDVEAWIFQGNQAADSLADSSFGNAAAIWSLWQTLTAQVHQIRVLRHHVHSTMVQVGRKAVRSAAPPDASVAAPKTPRLTAADLTPVDIPTFQLDDLPETLRFPGCDAIVAWIQGMDVPGHEVRLVSWFQLNIALETDLQCKGVVYKAKTKQWVAAKSNSADDFAKRTNRLARYIRAIAEAVGGTCKASHVRPDSGIIQFWTQSLQLRWPFSDWQRAEILLSDQQTRLNSVREVRGLV